MPIRVLIVEDDKTSVFTMRKMLMEKDYDIIGEAASGEEAVTQAMEHEPEVILMDISIHGEMDGVEAANAIKQFSDVPIIYMSGYSDTETVERAKRTTPFGYLLKPFTKKELEITIEMAMYKNVVDNQLRENELRLSTILANIPSAVIHTDPDRRIVFMNPLAELLTQHVLERSRGESVCKVLDLRDIDTEAPVEESDCLLFDTRRQGTHQQALKLYSANGEHRIVELWSVSIPDSTGSLQGYLLTLLDITQQYEAEQQIRTMAAALASQDDAVVITDARLEGDGPRVLYTTGGFSKITGYDEDTVAGEPIIDILGPLKDEHFFPMLEASMRKGHSFQGETICHARDSREYMGQWSVSPVNNSQGEMSQLVFVVRDISHLHRLQENIRQSQKIEAVGRLAGGIAHDFNNLLSVINSYSDLQMLKLEADTPAMKYAQQIRAAGKKGADLVSQLMTFSRRDKPAPNALDLSKVTDDIKGMLRRVIRENIELETSYEENLPLVLADQGQVEQTLINLCVNARDAMPNGGRIQIKIETQQVGEKQARTMGHARPGRHVVLSVTDSGCGMDEETQNHIFDPFFTTKDIGKGTGLGLSTVYGIMKQLHGFITVESALGEGTRFDLFFPVSKESKGSENAKSEEAEEAPHGSECIFVVEDDETFLDCISGLLSLHGYVVHTSSEGLDAMEQFKELGHRVNLLITDLVLPKISGREVATRLLEKNPSAKVIFMTGYDDQLDSFYQFPGDSIILQKPFPLNSLLQKVRALLDAKTAEK